MKGGTILWFRQDLRLRDNPALHAAIGRGQPIIPLYIWSPQDEGDWPLGAASRWWLHHSLAALDRDLRKCGSRLLLRCGQTPQVLACTVAQTGASAVFWNRRYEPAAVACAVQVRSRLQRLGVEAGEFNSALLLDPRRFRNRSDEPYRVYTPFFRAVLREAAPEKPLPRPRSIPPPRAWPANTALQSLGLLPQNDWHARLDETWRPGEKGAGARVASFVKRSLGAYRQARDLPAIRGTSGLSPHLHFGEIGPRQLWHAMGAQGRSSPFLKELLWREFAYHLLTHYPCSDRQPLRAEFARFPWIGNQRRLQAWQRGLTGVALVDAGMRELWATGWMHNRVRMVVASFLVKNLRVPWQHGARWFWDTLVDADLANNSLNWQWVAGCGADAAPFFRIFNPLTQARRFDPDDTYIRRWVPELRPGHPASYPPPIVDLRQSRADALRAYESMRRH